MPSGTFGTGEELVDPLPEGARLLHIGLPKTGTTALQSTAKARRSELLQHGVRYPGGGMNHREAVSALMGRRWGWIGPGSIVPPMKHWDRLLSEVDGEAERRIWISHEFASESDDATAQRFSDALGSRLHIAITLRPYSAILVSSWQQYLKGGTTHSFEHWLHKVLADPPDLQVTPSFHRRNDQSAVVRRWASVVGKDNVSVIVVDKAQPTLLTDSFETLFGLPKGFLVDESLGGLQANRAMSFHESEMLRTLNVAIKGRGVQWPEYEALIRNGAISRLLQGRLPNSDEAQPQLPKWAADRATQLGQRYAEEIGRSGVRIVGDVSSLSAPVPHTEDVTQSPAQIQMDLAAEFMAGLLSAALGRGPFFDALPEPPKAHTELKQAERALSSVRTPKLLAVLAKRIRRKALRIPRAAFRRGKRSDS